MPTLMFAGSSLSTVNVHVVRSTVTRVASEKQVSTLKQSCASGLRVLVSAFDQGPDS
jgi:hypothetical protein